MPCISNIPLSDDSYETVAEARSWKIRNGGRLVLARYRMYTANTTDVALQTCASKMVKAVDTVEGRAEGLPYQDKISW